MPKSIVASCCLLALAAGCGGPGAPPTVAQEQEGSLGQVGEMYRNYQLSKKKPPEKFADFASVRAVSGNGYDAVQSGAVVLRYGATLTDTKEEPAGAPSDEILAYERKVPESGGRVLYLNRAVKTLTPAEFKAAKLAGMESSATPVNKKGS